MTYHDRLIEAGARAIFAKSVDGAFGCSFDEQGGVLSNGDDTRDMARAALSAFLTILKEPSRAMLLKGMEAWGDSRSDIFQAMLSAISDEG